MKKNQMELSFDTPNSHRSGRIQTRRARGAHWWFEQMRQVVKRAVDPAPALTPRSEQIYFSLHRHHLACETTGEKRGLN